MTFDPMTGEPIEEKEGSSLQFDPMTGEPIGQTITPEPEQNIGGFDPMTGEPIGQTSAPNQNMGGFNPMTGEPIVSQEAQTSSGKKNKFPVVIGVVAAIAVAAVLICVVISSGLFAGKAGKVTVAIKNTFKKTPHFVEVLEPLNILGKDKYTISASGEIDSIKMNGEVRISNKEKQVSIKLDYDDYPSLEVLGSLDSKAVKVEIPVLSKNVFVYNYKGKNTGYLMDALSEDDVDIMNALLENVADGNAVTEKTYKDLQKVLKKEIKALKFTSAEKEEYTVNDKDVTCKGYTATITADNVISVVNGLEDVINDNLVSEFDTDELAEAFEDIRESAEYMEDIEVTFYIYKNKLAAVKMDSEEMNDEVELCFEGGDYRMQNMTLKTGSYKIQLKGEDSGSKEEFTLKTRHGNKSQELGSLEYNYENGKFSFELDDVSVSGKLTKAGSSVTLKINEINSYYKNLSPDVQITFSEGAKMQKFSGKEFDLGNADEDDFMDLAEDIEDEMYDSDIYYLLEELF